MATRGRTRLKNQARSRGQSTRGRILTQRRARGAANAGISGAKGVRGGTGRSRAGTTYRRGGKNFMFVPTGVGRTTMAVQTRGRRGRITAAGQVQTRRRKAS